jgi:VWFA-related protein
MISPEAKGEKMHVNFGGFRSLRSSGKLRAAAARLPSQYASPERGLCQDLATIRVLMLRKARLAALALPCIFAVAFSQQAPEAAPPSDGKFHLDVVVTPKSGPPVGGLEQKDFTVLNDKAPQTITSFHAYAGPEAPVEVVLFIDAVNLEFQRISYERQEIDRFLRANGGKLAHPTTLAIFTDTGARIQPNFTTDGNALATSLDRQTVALRSITRSAGFYGAVERFDLSMKALDQLAAFEASRPGRKMVLWISPGWPLLSGPGVQLDGKQQQQIFRTIVDVSAQLRRARITLYNINPLGSAENTLSLFYYQQFVKGVTKPSQVQGGNLGLQVLAVQSGGLVLNASNDVSALLKQAFADADAWYELSFQPAAGEPYEYHQLEVKVDKPGLVARTREGYYSPP